MYKENVKKDTLKKQSKKKKEEIRNKMVDQMKTVSTKISKCHIDYKSKKKLNKNFQDALLLRQTIGNSIIKLEEKFALQKKKMNDFVQKQSIDLLRVKNGKQLQNIHQNY